MIKIPEIDCRQVLAQIGDFIITTIMIQKKQGLVIGVSGGIDSAVVAKICKIALQDSNYNLRCYIMKDTSSDRKDIDDAIQFCKHFNMIYDVLDISPIIMAFTTVVPELFLGTNESYFHRGNLKSEVMGKVLSRQAAIHNSILVGTDNADEGFLGYYTLFGDGAVHMNPIGALSKRLVYEMGEYLKIPRSIIEKEPSAGLETGQTDEKDLGFSYLFAEIVRECLGQGISSIEEIANEIDRLLSKEEKKKHFGQEWWKSKQPFTETIEKVLERYKIGKSKEQIIHPPIATIALNYVEKGYL